MDGIKRATDLARAMLMARKLRHHDRWSPSELHDYQNHALKGLVEHAKRQSPFYAELYSGLDVCYREDLTQLPTIDKRAVLDNFSKIVGDSRLTLDALRDHIARVQSDEYFLGEYRVVATAGTSGLRGIFLFNRQEWTTVLANTLRWENFVGLRPKYYRRVRVCSIGADNPIHVTNRIPASGDVGLFKMEYFLATQPIDRLVADLNTFQPDVILPYPSVGALLAREQIAGRLTIEPSIVSTHSEVLTKEMKQLIEQAWGIKPFNHYGMTEEPHVATDCENHTGMHVLEDICILEIVDENNNAVPDGVLGTKCLLTNLYNRTLPLIRYEISDMLAKSRQPCSCGRPFPLLQSIGGRSEDLLRLGDEDGREVLIPPMVLGLCVEAFSEIEEYEVRHDQDRIDVKLVVGKPEDVSGLTSRLIERLQGAIKEHGAVPPPIEVSLTAKIERSSEHMGKITRVGAAKSGGRRADTN